MKSLVSDMVGCGGYIGEFSVGVWLPVYSFQCCFSVGERSKRRKEGQKEG